MRVITLAAALGLAILATVAAQAQNRSVGALNLLPTAQAEVALAGDNYVFGGLSLLHDRNMPSTFSAGQLELGYEHFWNQRWSWGGTFRTIGNDRYLESGMEFVLAPELLLRHWNTFGTVNFRQRLGVDYLLPMRNTNLRRASVSLRLDVDKVFAVGSQLALRPRLAFESRAFLRFQREEFEPKERVIDFTTIRGEVGVKFSPRFDLTPWFAYQSSYYFELPQTDSNGTITIPGGRGNFVLPLLGLDLRYTLGENATNAERRQLPTQH